MSHASALHHGPADAPLAPVRVSPHADRRGLKAGQQQFGRLLLLPALIAFAGVILWPFVRALTLSLYKDTVDTPTPFFIGLANFSTVFADPAILGSFVTTAIYVVAATAGTMVAGARMGAGDAPGIPGPGRAAGAVAAALGAALHRLRVRLGMDLQQPLRRHQRRADVVRGRSSSRRPGSRRRQAR